MLVRDAMTKPVVTVGPDHTLRQAAELMAQRRVGSAIVTDPDGVVLVAESPTRGVVGYLTARCWPTYRANGPVAWVDELLARTPTPRFIADAAPALDTFPPGSAIFVVAAAAILLAAIELAAILRANNITASRFITCAAAMAGLVSWAAVPTS